MSQTSAQRTLVKSPPELWAEVSDAETLARHLAEFGEIRITRVEPESTVAWEGERASGTVELEPSGWGTRVTLRARALAPAPEQVSAPEEVVAPEPVVVPKPAIETSPSKPSFFARLWRRRPEPAAPEPEPEPLAPAALDPEPPEREPPEPERPAPDPDAVLAAALDALGAAHHRPFSRG